MKATRSGRSSNVTPRASLHVCVVFGPARGSCYLVFRAAAGTSHFPEGLFHLKMNDPVWRAKHGFESESTPWWHKGQPVCTRCGNTVRLFVARRKNTPAKCETFELGNKICQDIDNCAKGMCHEIEIEPRKFFWHQGKVTMQRVTSRHECCLRIFRQCGHPEEPTWWKKHHRHALCCFAPGAIKADLGRIFCAPKEMSSDHIELGSDSDTDDSSHDGDRTCVEPPPAIRRTVVVRPSSKDPDDESTVAAEPITPPCRQGSVH